MKEETDINYKKVVHAPKTEKPVRCRDFKPRVDVKLCKKCMLCVVFCPVNCIEVSKTGNPSIDYSHCNGCLICLRECPYGAITEERE